MNATIDSLLALRQTKRVGAPSSPERARKRLPVSRYLAEHFVAFDPLRNHLFHPGRHRTTTALEQSGTRSLAVRLRDLGWIQPGPGKSWRLTGRGGSRVYLSGGWLEEQAFCAHEAADVDEACYGQEVGWSVNGITGKNEIDVLARRGGVLSFTSCKTLQPGKAPGFGCTALRDPRAKGHSPC